MATLYKYYWEFHVLYITTKYYNFTSEKAEAVMLYGGLGIIPSFKVSYVTI